MCACDLGCACVGWGRGIGRIDFRASPNANRPDSCARMQAAHREKQNPQSRKPKRLTRRIDRMDRPPMHATGCGRFRLVGRRFPQVHTIRPARPRRRQLASTHCCRTRRVRRIASLCFPPRPRGRAVPAPAQLPGGRGLGVASCTGSSDRPHPVRVWPACNAAFLMRGAWRAQVHRIIVPRSLTLRSVTCLMLIGCALTSVSSPTCRRCPLLSFPPLELLID